MRIVTAQELESWLASGKVLEQDSRGPKVVILSNGLFLKIFHTRRHVLLTRWRPAALRFARNAKLLAEQGIAVPRLKEALWLKRTEGLSACTYQPLPGTSVENILKETPEQIPALIPQLAQFIHRLHRNGVYFRSLHLGNLLLLPNGEFGLIDFLDLTQKKRPLSAWEVKRNFAHLQRYLTRRKLEGFPLEQLLSCYAALGKATA